MDLNFGVLYLFNPGTFISRIHLDVGMACYSFHREYVEGWRKLTIPERYLVKEEVMQMVSSLHLGDLQVLHLLYGILPSECCSSTPHRIEFSWS